MGRSNRANPNPAPATSNAVAGQGTPGLVQPYQQQMGGENDDGGDTNDVYGMKHSGFRPHFGHIKPMGLTPTSTSPNHAGTDTTQSLTPAGQWEDAPMGVGAYHERTDLVPRTTAAAPKTMLKQGGFYGMKNDGDGPARAGGKQL